MSNVRIFQLGLPIFHRKNRVQGFRGQGVGVLGFRV